MSNEQSIRDEIAEIIAGEEEYPHPRGYAGHADMILASPAIRRIQAEAIREATRDFATGGWVDTFTAEVVDDVTAVIAADRWFVAEADRIEQGDEFMSGPTEAARQHLQEWRATRERNSEGNDDE